MTDTRMELFDRLRDVNTMRLALAETPEQKTELRKDLEEIAHCLRSGIQQVSDKLSAPRGIPASLLYQEDGVEAE